MTSGVDTQYIFTAQTTDANSATHHLSFPNSKTVVKCYGTWNGANITFQTLAPNGSTWINLFDLSNNPVTITANNQFVISDFVYDESFRAVQANSGGSTSLNVTLQAT